MRNSPRNRFSLLALVLGAIVMVGGCGGKAPEAEASWAALRASAYSRGDRVIGAVRMLKPADDPELATSYLLAPLLLEETDELGSGVSFGHVAGDATTVLPDDPTVYVRRSTVQVQGREHEQWTYVWWYPPAIMRGLRMTLGGDGFPIVYEILGDPKDVRSVFVAVELDAAAAAEFGPPLPGRSFAIERSVDDAPDVVVLDIVEPGPTPLGPFLTLAPGSRAPLALHCRCAPSRMSSITTSTHYQLETRQNFPESWPVPPTPPATLLRLPTVSDCEM